MGHFLVINPNTSKAMTDSIESTVSKILMAGDSCDVIKSEIGPESLESFYEYNLAAAGIAYTLKNKDLNQYDGVLLSCFGDPGLYGLKEVINKPVIGIAEASLSLSLLLGSKFGILVALKKAVPMMENMVQQYGLSERSAGVFPLGIPVLDIENDNEKALEMLLSAGESAVSKGAEVLILGCAGMTGFNYKIEQELKVTVIDPVVAGFNMLKSIVHSNLYVARTGLFSKASSKEIIGMDNYFQGNW